MIGRRTAVGLSLLCALLFSAIAVQSASAAKAVNTTAVTCVKGGEEDFADEHCEEFVEAGNGEYGHVPITKDQTTKFEGDLAGNKKAILKSKAAGAAVEIVCTTVKATGELHNVETPEKKHTVTGKLKTTFEACKVEKPAKCVVVEPIETNTEFEGVEGLGAEKNEMGIEHKPEGGGGTFVELDIKDAPGVQCNIEGKYTVTGTAVQTGSAAPTAKYTGATGVFTKAMTEETLKFGPEKASFEVTSTVKMHKDDPEPENPIALTTTT